MASGLQGAPLQHARDALDNIDAALEALDAAASLLVRAGLHGGSSSVRSEYDALRIDRRNLERAVNGMPEGRPL